ncbi:hypothetical protein [Ferrimonas balearica]|uniref:hypothetical protein n=1 Tax=Ferrimonas balearica TaxID=44012 RepID=UPI001C98FE09|nr:hypothetical protein [Ferrimonas balearica]MBY5991028.1 hypothetical protein [Ferrimonas balearica]
MQLFGAQGAGSAAIEVALNQAGVAYRLIEAATWEPDSELARLRRQNPCSRSPP